MRPSTDPMASLKHWIGSILLTAVVAAPLNAAEPSVKPAVPLDPVDAVLQAFETHRIVALGEGNHGNEQGHRFRLQLIRSPRFSGVVNDIVVESGNSLYQQVMDRYVRGENVSYEELRRCWENTTQFHAIWDVPIYQEFYRAVRDLNASLPKERQIRVILGDAPVDWERVQKAEDYAKQPQRSDSLVAELIEREVLSKNRRALVVYGELHLHRRELLFMPPAGIRREDLRMPFPGDSIVQALEKSGTKVFSIWTNTSPNLSKLQASVADWQPPALTLIAGTPLGATPFTSYHNSPLLARQADGKSARLLMDPAGPQMQEQFDAVLYLGAKITYSMPSPALCTDKPYLDMRFSRMRMAGMEMVIEQAKQYCAAATKTP